MDINLRTLLEALGISTEDFLNQAHIKSVNMDSEQREKVKTYEMYLSPWKEYYTASRTHKIIIEITQECPPQFYKDDKDINS